MNPDGTETAGRRWEQLSAEEKRIAWWIWHLTQRISRCEQVLAGMAERAAAPAVTGERGAW